MKKNARGTAMYCPTYNEVTYCMKFGIKSSASLSMDIWTSCRFVSAWATMQVVWPQICHGLVTRGLRLASR